MKDEAIKKIETIVQDRKNAHETLSKRSKVYRAFLDLEKQAYSDGALEKKYKELIAIGISLIINCESCLEWHINEALTAGASEDQILETIEVGIEMGGGPATVSSRFALRALEYHTQRTVS